MEIISLTLSSPQTFFVALIFTFLSFFLALLAVRLLPDKPKSGGAASATSSSSGSGKVCTCCARHREEVVLGSDSGAVSAPHLNGGTGTDVTEKPLIFTFLSFFLALLAVRLLPDKPKSGGAASATSSSSGSGKVCTCCARHREEVVLGSDSGAVSAQHLNGGTGTDVTEKPTTTAAVLERQTGASMMEQLVPEITTHALSYLDYPSLCRLSMTNSLMRKAANDDNAWKALYHKDFTLEQDSVTPVNGWKAYYAATRVIVNINTEFFNHIRGRSLPEMSRLWLNADYVKCVHASGELFSGYNAVIQSWQLAFNWEQGVNFQIRDVCARVLTDMAWVTMKTFVEIDTGLFSVTNVYEFHNGRWYMVHHHSSVMDGEGEQQIVQG